MDIPWYGIVFIISISNQGSTVQFLEKQTYFGAAEKLFLFLYIVSYTYFANRVYRYSKNNLLYYPFNCIQWILFYYYFILYIKEKFDK